ncbi:ribosome modulation factor [Aliikangiella maris]|uniref:Ribosome modulation factor n=2 Tax=Aliikangiella maris TaxID=3162458 RepID=A0ABV2BUI2_9GAMM
MKRQKRDRFERAHSKGYYAAINGKSSEECPFTSLEAREHWLGGWREAKTEMGKGYFT